MRRALLKRIHPHRIKSRQVLEHQILLARGVRALDHRPGLILAKRVIFV